ncbi:MAG: polysaccharide export protein [Deltaproteobacteria bacterium]|nr:polysaccharide export protein [Deltaproteobacteria bacterium]
MTRQRLLLLCTMACLHAACSPAATTAYVGERTDINQAVQASTLGPGDSVAVRVYLHKDLDGVYVVAPTGGITFPLLGEIHCEGLTPDGLGKRIAAQLAAGYIRNPQVIVSIAKLNSKNVYVLGKVTKPGKFVFVDRMTIIDAITLAGGFASLAEKNYTIVTRNDRRIPLPVEKIMQGLASNFFLEPGDIVYVPQSIM